MKVITLHQPWAQAIALGLKHYETRSWGTRYRGPVAFHAAKTIPPYAREIARTFTERYGPLPLGVVVAVAELVDVHAAERVAGLSPREALFGNFDPGRLAWELQGMQRLAVPFPLRGVQGLVSLTPECERLIRLQLEEPAHATR